MMKTWELYADAADAHPLFMDCLKSLLLWALGDAVAQRLEGLGFRPRRFLTTCLYATLFVGPFGHGWYLGLEALVGRLFEDGSVAFIATKVVLDLSIYGMLHVICFFAVLTLAEGGSWQDVKAKVRADFWATYLTECGFWSVFQSLNFALVPVPYQLLAVNCATVLDSTFLCWARGRADWASDAKHLLLRLPRLLAGGGGGEEGSGSSSGNGGGKGERLDTIESEAEMGGAQGALGPDKAGVQLQGLPSSPFRRLSWALPRSPLGQRQAGVARGRVGAAGGDGQELDEGEKEEGREWQLEAVYSERPASPLAAPGMQQQLVAATDRASLRAV